MTTHQFGDKDAHYVLVQAIDKRDLADFESEINAIKALTTKPFLMLAVEVDDWNRDLSPWQAPAVFGNEPFGGGADQTLDFINSLCTADKHYLIGGYSLAGLFSLWAACQTSGFSAVAAASPSVWFPGFVDYIKQHKINSPAVYLSLGDREARTRNQIMATVADKIVQCQRIWDKQGVLCTLEWNPGNHFKDAARRTAKAFAWAMENAFKAQ